jgi:DNA modification methylase
MPYSHLSDGDPLNSFLSTRTTMKKHPIHRWYNFVPGFSPEFVEYCCRESKIYENEIVLDPFSGCGTTQVACNLINQSSVGYEIHPFLYQILQGKTLSLFIPYNRIIDIKNRIKELTKNDENVNLSIDAETYLNKLVPSEKLEKLLKSSLIVNEVEDNEKYLCIICISKILELISSSSTDGIYKAPDSRKNSNDFDSSVNLVFKEIINDIEFVQKNNILNKSINYNQSSENMNQVKDNSVDLVITSPPYLNNFDYAEMTRMQLYFWRYASNWKEITDKIRNKLIINTTTALNEVKNKQEYLRSTLPEDFLEKIDPLVKELALKKKNKKGKKDYNLLLYPYFSQMSTIINEIYRVLDKNSIFNMIVADSALYGVHIKTDKLLAKLMKYHGFEIININLIRKRGTRWILNKREGAKEGLGDYHIKAKKM